ncbi:hypothetical protein DFH28DRAFT_905502, partial [Melampsora americana]
MVLCTCFNCIKIKHTGQNGNDVNGRWVHPATRRKHRSETSSEATASLIALAQEFSQKAQIEDINPIDASSEEDDEPTTEQPKLTELIYLVMYFIGWLYLECRMSRINCRKARDHIMGIVQLCTQIKPESGWTSFIPKDVQTITRRLNLEAELERFVCCTKCYSLYEPEVAPPECGYQELSTTKVCGTELF